METLTCKNCGLESDGCTCLRIQVIPEASPDFKFEWAFESITSKNSCFREIFPIYDENT